MIVVALPNHLHEEVVASVAAAGKAVLCTKPLGRNADEAFRMLGAVERAGVFAGYLEDLCYTPKTLKSLAAVRAGAIGDVTWVRSRETHPGPHSAWFWDGRLTGGGAIIDLGCHCIEIIRNFVGKGNRPVEVMCHTDTLVHPIADEDNAVALIRFESGALGQFEVSWTFRGGMDLRDEVAGTHGTIWANHFLRTGLEMFTAGGGSGGYVAEKAETSAGWLFPVGDEVSELGYVDMFTDMFRAIDYGTEPMETFYDGYVVNAVMDACYRSAKSGALGAGDARRVARRHDAAHRIDPGGRTRDRWSSSAKSCPTAGPSSSSRTRRAATSPIGSWLQADGAARPASRARPAVAGAASVERDRASRQGDTGRAHALARAPPVDRVEPVDVCGASRLRRASVRVRRLDDARRGHDRGGRAVGDGHVDAHRPHGLVGRDGHLAPGHERAAMALQVNGRIARGEVDGGGCAEGIGPHRVPDPGHDMQVPTLCGVVRACHQGGRGSCCGRRGAEHRHERQGDHGQCAEPSHAGTSVLCSLPTGGQPAPGT